jgi:hypothetical protein
MATARAPGSGTLNLHFTEEQPGNQTWLPDGGDYSATAHYRTETAGPQCTLVDDGHEATSGPLTEAEALYLSEYKNNTYAYLGFDVSKYVDDNIIRTNSDCSTDEFVAQHQYAQFRAAHGDCPQLPRADGDPASGLRASKTTQDGHLALDFTCNDTVTTGGSTTTVQVSGTLVESP